MKKRSKRYKELKEKMENKVYPIDEALKLTKENSNTKFDASVEVHINLRIDSSKGDQQVRGTVTLPHSIGKKIKIACFVEEANEKLVKEAGADIVGGENLINEIKKTEKTDFDIAVAESSMMRNLAKLGKILGTKGLMPNPKNETVSDNPAKIVKELKSGKISFKADPAGVLHQMIGKVSLDDNKLKENFEILMEAVAKAKPEKLKGEYIKSITMCSSMGLGVKVKK
jgi:large subunit ribosomal protein L1